MFRGMFQAVQEATQGDEIFRGMFQQESAQGNETSSSSSSSSSSSFAGDESNRGLPFNLNGLLEDAESTGCLSLSLGNFGWQSAYFRQFFPQYILPFLNTHPNVSDLKFVNHRLRDKDTEILTQLRHIQVLSIGCVDLKAADLNVIMGCKQIHTLDIGASVCITDSDVSILSGNSNIRTLIFCNSRIGYLGVEMISKMTNLTSLDLSNRNTHPEEIKVLVSNQNLGVLRLQNTLVLKNTEICREALKWLSVSKGLRELYLGDNYLLEKVIILSENKSLTLLNLDYNHIGDNEFRVLVTNMPNLKVLSVAFNGIGDAGVGAIQSSNIEQLNLEGNTRLTDEGADILARCGNLRMVNLNITGITEKGIKVLEQVSPERQKERKELLYSFILGTYSKRTSSKPSQSSSGAQSSKVLFFSQHCLFDRRLVREIFSFLPQTVPFKFQVNLEMNFKD